MNGAIETRRPGMRPNAYQTEHDLLREVLSRFLVAKVQSPRSAGGFDQMVCRAVAALDSLLAAHSVDDRGRCWSCRGPGWLGRRPRVCLVFRKAHYWLRQPTHQVQAHLAAELGVDVTAPLGMGDPEATEVLPRVTDDSPTDFLQTPAVPSPLPPRGPRGTGRPDRDHGGAGDAPENPRPRRAVVLVRYRPGVVGETARTVHVVPLPTDVQAGAVGALCGAALSLADIETVTPGQGMPCAVCLVTQALATSPADEPGTGDADSADAAGLTCAPRP